MGDVTEEELYDGFREQAVALEKGGADIIIIETMSAIDEASLAVKAARENTKCTVIITMTFTKDSKGRISYNDGSLTSRRWLISMKNAGAHIIGSNCGNGIEDMIGIVKAIRAIDKIIPLLSRQMQASRNSLTGKLSFVNLRK